MKVVPESLRSFIASSILKNNRLDGRKRNEWRQLDIAFGSKFGVCAVSLGNSRILATISGEIVEPKSSRASEGSLKIMVDLSPMASPNFEVGGKNVEETVALVRVLERAIRDARCIDMEGLCLIPGKKCWSLESSIVVYNADGNLIELSSIALVAALAHYRRPDVTVESDGKLTIHPFDEKSPIPLTLLHYPFCTKICFTDQKGSFIVDPTEDEELVSEWSLVVAANSHQELTAICVTGRALIEKENILAASATGIERTKTLTSHLKKALVSDREEREKLSGKNVGFRNHIQKKKPVFFGPSSHVDLAVAEHLVDEESEEEDESMTVEDTKAFRFIPDTKEVGQGGPSSWNPKEIEEGGPSGWDTKEIEEGGPSSWNPKEIEEGGPSGWGISDEEEGEVVE